MRSIKRAAKAINGVNGAPAGTNVGIGTTTPQHTSDVNGTANFTGLVTLASGQQFPGTGMITGVTAGTELTGGGTSGTGPYGRPIQALDGNFSGRTDRD
ncbi:MAG: hypothetical protein WA172_14600 [Terriglobales bacterium]